MDLLTVELGHWKQLCSQPNILPRSADPLLHILVSRYVRQTLKHMLLITLSWSAESPLHILVSRYVRQTLKHILLNSLPLNQDVCDR